MFTLPTQTTTPLEAIGFSIPSKEYLVKQYVGKKLRDVRTPRFVVDRAVVKRNCERLAVISKKSGKKIRIHIKTHKVKVVKVYEQLMNIDKLFSTFRLLRAPRSS